MPLATDPGDAMVAAAERVLEFVRPGAVVGLGSGRAASVFVRVLGARVARGLEVRAVPTSQATADLAAQLQIPLVTLEQALPIDVTVDGADEVDPQLDLIKGRGGAVVREKIVAAAARQRIILIGPEKLVPVLGTRGVLPVEVIPFGLEFCRRQLEELGCAAEPRRAASGLFVSDNGNHLLDCRIGPIESPQELDRGIRSIPGVVDTGFFLGMTDAVVVADSAGVQIRWRERA